MSPWELFRTLSSKSRLAVIKALGTAPLRYSEIMKSSGLNTTDLSRQLTRLIKDSIIEKDSSDRYQLTQFGRLAATTIPTASFIVANQTYFSNHDLSVIPPRLIEDIASLKKGDMVSARVVFSELGDSDGAFPVPCHEYAVLYESRGCLLGDPVEVLVEPGAGVHLPEIIGDHEHGLIIRACYLIKDFLGD
jgi:hypothetical protein